MYVTEGTGVDGLLEPCLGHSGTALKARREYGPKLKHHLASALSCSAEMTVTEKRVQVMKGMAR